MLLYPDPPYDFPLLLDFLRRFTCPLQDVPLGADYYRVLTVDEGLVLAQVSNRGTIDHPVLEVVLHGHTDEHQRQQATRQVRHVLAVDDQNRARFFEQARQDTPYWNVIAPLVGLPALRTATLFEALISVVIEQQIAWKTAQAAQYWFLQWGGRVFRHEGHEFYAFPAPEQIAAASLDDLRPLKITFRRINQIRSIAAQMVDGSLDLSKIMGIDADIPATYRALMQIKGVGHWTAAVTMARAWGAWDYVPDNDVALQAAVNRYFFEEAGRCSAAQLRQIFLPFGHFAGLAAYYVLTRWVMDNYPART